MADRQRPYIAMIGEDLTLAADPTRLAAVTPPPARQRAAQEESAPRLERIAIRDFEHVRPDAANDWMRRALSQDVLTAFSELHQLDVYDETMLRFVTRDAPDVLDAAQRAGIGMLVEGAYWVQDNELSVSAQVKSVRPLQLVASAHAEGPVDQFSKLTGRLVTDLLAQLPVTVPGPLAERLAHAGGASLAARRLLAEADGGNGVEGPRAPGAARSAVPPGASLWNPTQRPWFRWLALADFLMAHPSLAAPAPDVEGELRGVLEGYRKALEAKDLAALRLYYEDFPEGQQAALARYFDAASGLRIELSDVRVAIIGDAAAVSFTRHDRFIDGATGQPQEVTVRVTKRFARGASGWVIQNEP